MSDIEVVTVTKYKIGGYTFDNLEAAEHHARELERIERSKELRHEIAGFNSWLAGELRAVGLPYNSKGCAEFMLTYSDKVVDRLGYEVIEVD